MLSTAFVLAAYSYHADLSIDSIKPYKINEQIANQTVDLKHGQSLRAFPMDKVSNAMFTQVGSETCFLSLSLLLKWL